MNDMKKSREDSLRNAFIINNGIQYIAEELLIMDKKSVDQYGFSKIEQVEAKQSISDRRTSLNKLKDFVNANKMLFRSVSALNSRDHEKSRFRLRYMEKSEKLENIDLKLDITSMASLKSFDSPNSSTPGSSTPNENQNIFRKTQSIEEFYQTRLAYDFQTLNEDDI